MNGLTKILIGVFFGIAFSYIWVKFWNTHNFDIGRWPIYSKQVVSPKQGGKERQILPSVTPSATPTPRPRTSIQKFVKYLTSNGEKNREYALTYLSKYYSGDELTAADNILKKEAGYRTDAVNEIGCGGMPQACPATKMGCALDQSGLDCQLNFFVNYIKSRYQGSPLIAWAHHLSVNWY